MKWKQKFSKKTSGPSNQTLANVLGAFDELDTLKEKSEGVKRRLFAAKRGGSNEKGKSADEKFKGGARDLLNLPMPVNSVAAPKLNGGPECRARRGCECPRRCGGSDSGAPSQTGPRKSCGFSMSCLGSTPRRANRSYAARRRPCTVSTILRTNGGPASCNGRH